MMVSVVSCFHVWYAAILVCLLTVDVYFFIVFYVLAGQTFIMRVNRETMACKQTAKFVIRS